MSGADLGFRTSGFIGMFMCRSIDDAFEVAFMIDAEGKDLRRLCRVPKTGGQQDLDRLRAVVAGYYGGRFINSPVRYVVYDEQRRVLDSGHVRDEEGHACLSGISGA
jgi:hypothetical protein